MYTETLRTCKVGSVSHKVRISFRDSTAHRYPFSTFSWPRTNWEVATVFAFISTRVYQVYPFAKIV